MKVLITGANGFIGRQLAQDMQQTPYQARLALRQLPQKNDASLDRVAVGAINAHTQWQQALSDCDVVIHTAARVHIMQETAENPLSLFRGVNVEGTLNLARQAVKAGVKRFIFISSIKVNGEWTTTYPFTADDVPHPQDAYGLSKLEAEQQLLALAHETGLELVIIRPPLVYGPGAKGNFQRLVQSIQKGWPLPLKCIVNQRSFVYVNNLSNLIIKCIEHPKAVNRIFLVSDGEDLSTPELLKKISLALNKPVRLLPIPYYCLSGFLRLIRKKAMLQRLTASLQVDMSKTCELLSWQPPLSVDEGLQAMMQSLREKTDTCDII